METHCLQDYCPFVNISWFWYVVSVLVTFAVGAMWYGVWFSKEWLAAVQYKCKCGADLSKGEKCTCESRSWWPMITQFIATALVGLMYFVIVQWSGWVALGVAIAISAWMKAGLLFRIPEWRRYVALALIDVGYFFIASLIFMLFTTF